MVNSHRARMLLPGVADLDTLRYFSGLAGEEETPRDDAHDGRRRRLADDRGAAPAAGGAGGAAPAAPGHALLLYGRIPPAQVRLRMWFADRRLRRLAA